MIRFSKRALVYQSKSLDEFVSVKNSLDAKKIKYQFFFDVSYKNYSLRHSMRAVFGTTGEDPDRETTYRITVKEKDVPAVKLAIGDLLKEQA